MKESCNKATVVLAAAAFAVCSQVQAETRWDQVDPASGSTELARALAQPCPRWPAARSLQHTYPIGRGVALNGDRFFNCRAIRFAFPQLRYDPAAKQVLLGEHVIVRDRGFWQGGRAD